MEYVKDENEPQLTPEEYLAARKSSMRTKSWWAIGIGVFIVAGHLLLFAIVILSGQSGEMIGFADLFRSIFFVLGLFAIAGGAFGLREARRLTFEDLVPTREAIEFSRQIESIKPWFSYVMVGSIVAVFLTQMVTDPGAASDDGPASIMRAGLIKPLVYYNGEWWRLLTGATVHAGALHIFFNGYALYGFGSLIEFISNRAHLANVMLLSVIGGSLASLIFMPDANSVGASGGIMGLIGYLAVYGFRRRRQLMPGFLRAMLTNIAFIAAFGVIAYQIIDNFAHFGGLLIGVGYGYVSVPRDLHENPREVSPAVTVLGYLSLAVFAAIAVFSILLIRGVIGG